MDALDQHISNQLTVEGEAKNYLSETAKWAKFLSIVGFVFIGLIAIMLLGTVFIGGDGLGGLGLSEGIGILPLLVLVIYFYPIFKLYKFSRHAKNSIAATSSSELTHALDNLKALYKFMGILTLIIVVLYGIFFAFMLLGGMASSF